MNTANVDHQRVAFRWHLQIGLTTAIHWSVEKAPHYAQFQRGTTRSQPNQDGCLQVSFNDGLPITATDAYATCQAAVERHTILLRSLTSQEPTRKSQVWPKLSRIH